MLYGWEKPLSDTTNIFDIYLWVPATWARHYLFHFSLTKCQILHLHWGHKVNKMYSLPSRGSQSSRGEKFQIDSYIQQQYGKCKERSKRGGLWKHIGGVGQSFLQKWLLKQVVKKTREKQQLELGPRAESKCLSGAREQSKMLGGWGLGMMAEDRAESRSFKASCDMLRSFPSKYLIEYFIPSRRILWEKNFGKHRIKKTFLM